MRSLATGWLLVFALVLSCCGAAAAAAAEAGKHDPCSFLKVDEVEAIMGPLAGPPYRSSGASPSANGSECRYEAQDRRSIRLEVQWDGGKDFMSMLGATQAMLEQAGLKQLKLVDGTTVAGHWDQAGVNSCCEFDALQTDRLVTVDVSGSKATVAQAASLADDAIQRLDQPLGTRGADGIKAAQDRAAQRPKPRSICELLTQADAEAIAGARLQEPPRGDNNSCTYVWPLSPQIPDYEVKLAVVWQGGFSEMRTAMAAVGSASSMIGVANLLKTSGADQNSGPSDTFSKSIIRVSAAKNDVMVSVEGGPIRQDIQQAFVERAISNLNK